MNTFNAYFKRHFLSTWVRPVIFSVLGLLILLITCSSTYNNWNTNNSAILITQSMIGYVTTFAAIVATLMPILEFSHFNNKKNIDTLFSLPLDKNKMLLAHYLNGALQIFLSVTIVYAVWLITWVYAPYTKIHEGYSLLIYPFITLCALIVYTLYSFIFLQANTTVDGCTFMFLYSFVFYILTFTVFRFFDKHFSNDFVNELSNICRYAFPESILSRMSVIANNLITPHMNWITISGYDHTIRVYEYKKISDVIQRFDASIYVPLFFVVLSVAGVYVTAKTFKKRSPLNVGEISESWLGYRILGPIFSICGVLIFNNDSILDAPLVIFVLIFMFLGYMLYRRGLRFKIPDIAVMAIAVLLTIFGVSL